VCVRVGVFFCVVVCVSEMMCFIQHVGGGSRLN
jgi:hypothetical protein